MTDNPFYLLSILTSALFTFFTAAFVVEIALALFRIRSQRTQATLRLLPFVSLLLEVTYHKFGVYNFLNPLSCYSCLQKLFLFLFFPDLKCFLAEHRISLISYLGSGHALGYFKFLFAGWIGLTLFMSVRWALQLYSERKWLKRVMQRSGSCDRQIQNAALQKALNKADVRIFVSEEVNIPMATYDRQILMPQTLIAKLSQWEFESIIVHELDHIRKQDPKLRLFTEAVSAIFWWVPTGWYRRLMVRSQEMACDRAIFDYGYDASTFASALITAWKQPRTETQGRLCALLNHQKETVTRFQVILGVQAAPRESILLSTLIIGFEGAVLGACAALL